MYSKVFHLQHEISYLSPCPMTAFLDVPGCPPRCYVSSYTFHLSFWYFLCWLYFITATSV